MTQMPSSERPTHAFRRWLGQRVLKATGWTFDGTSPVARSYVLIAAPHSTNWDLFFMLLLAWSAGPGYWVTAIRNYRITIYGISVLRVRFTDASDTSGTGSFI